MLSTCVYRHGRRNYADPVSVVSGQYLEADPTNLVLATKTRTLLECLTKGAPNRDSEVLNFHSNTGLCQVYRSTDGQLTNKAGAYYVTIE